jgi:hypothetical protein
VKANKPPQRTATRVPHGTYQGWNWHQRNGVPTCQDCRIAEAHYMRDHRKRHLVPIELPDEFRFTDVAGGVGLAYAHAVRESA